MSLENTPATMAAFTVDETSAPTSIEDSNHQQNGIVVAAGYPRHLTLDVGGRKFKVSCDTLKSESGWFKRQLSGRFGPWEPELDGSYFMDTDPDLFEYLLRFMRRPEVFPLFYSKMNGFDYDLYNRLQAEALYFQTDTLYEWIKDKRYLNAIKVKTSSLDIRVVHSLDYVQQEILPVHKTEELHVVPRTRKVYLCPRQIAGHKGHPELCGAACHKRQADNAVEYEDVGFLQVVSLQKEIVFDEKVCRDD